jgi:hypothetical protein
MKYTKNTFLAILLLALALSACTAKSDATPTVSPDDIHTQVVLTLTSIATNATPTASPSPSATPTVQPSPTEVPPSPTTAPTTGPTVAVATPPPTTGGCDNSIYVSDVTIPDDTVMAPGQTFTKTWKVQNSGTCTWSTSYKLVSYAGTVMGGTSTAISASVAPNTQVNVSVALAAPSTAGTYTGYWRLQNASGVSFGQAIYVKIQVSTSAATLTPTVTATGGATATSTTGAATATATNTSAPATATSTVTPTVTFTPTPTK